MLETFDFHFSRSRLFHEKWNRKCNPACNLPLKLCQMNSSPTYSNGTVPYCTCRINTCSLCFSPPSLVCHPLSQGRDPATGTGTGTGCTTHTWSSSPGAHHLISTQFKYSGSPVTLRQVVTVLHGNSRQVDLWLVWFSVCFSSCLLCFLVSQESSGSCSALCLLGPAQKGQERKKWYILYIQRMKN